MSKFAIVWSMLLLLKVQLSTHKSFLILKIKSHIIDKTLVVSFFSLEFENFLYFQKDFIVSGHENNKEVSIKLYILST